MKLVAFALWCAMASTVVRSAETATTLMPPSGPVAAGGTAQFDLVSLNPGSFEIPFEAPAVLTGRLETARGSWPSCPISRSTSSTAVARSRR
ncbi:MAG: hypothetical protein NTV51_18665 [Verrucomicrobia bacterium]|nr:hypothetical protein [Verrucomicrobiota bacterium]